jgi:hypothetical protein
MLFCSAKNSVLSNQNFKNKKNEYFFKISFVELQSYADVQPGGLWQ